MSNLEEHMYKLEKLVKDGNVYQIQKYVKENKTREWDNHYSLRMITNVPDLDTNDYFLKRLYDNALSFFLGRNDVLKCIRNDDNYTMNHSSALKNLLSENKTSELYKYIRTHSCTGWKDDIDLYKYYIADQVDLKKYNPKIVKDFFKTT